MKAIVQWCRLSGHKEKRHRSAARSCGTAFGFFHPYGVYTETVTDQAGNFYGIWAEGESKAGTGDLFGSLDATRSGQRTRHVFSRTAKQAFARTGTTV